MDKISLSVLAKQNYDFLQQHQRNRCTSELRVDSSGKIYAVENISGQSWRLVRLVKNCFASSLSESKQVDPALAKNLVAARVNAQIFGHLIPEAKGLRALKALSCTDRKKIQCLLREIECFQKDTPALSKVGKEILDKIKRHLEKTAFTAILINDRENFDIVAGVIQQHVLNLGVLGLMSCCSPSFQIGVLTNLIPNLIPRILLRLFSGDDSHSELYKLEQDPNSEYYKYCRSAQDDIITAGLIDPIKEEILFRGILQTGVVFMLSSMMGQEEPFLIGLTPSSLIGIILSSVFFGLAHLQNRHEHAKFQAVATGILGAIFGVLYEKYGILAPMGSHIANNTTAFFFSTLRRKFAENEQLKKMMVELPEWAMPLAQMRYSGTLTIEKNGQKKTFVLPERSDSDSSFFSAFFSWCDAMKACRG